MQYSSSLSVYISLEDTAAIFLFFYGCKRQSGSLVHTENLNLLQLVINIYIVFEKLAKFLKQLGTVVFSKHYQNWSK